MQVNFKKNGKTYIGFVVGSPEWEALDFSEQEKAAIIHQAQYDEAVSLRMKAYTAESDPLRNEWKYEEETGNPNADQYKQKWLDKVVEIKARYPLPSES